MSVTTEAVSPKATPLPPLPAEDPLTPDQWKTLFAISDTIIPAVQSAAGVHSKGVLSIPANDHSTAVTQLKSLASSSSADESVVDTYLSDIPSTNPAFRDTLYRFFGFYLPQKSANELKFILNILK
jgi:hypothetical protein